MKTLLRHCVLLASLTASVFAQTPAPAAAGGKVLFHETFATPDSLSTWRPGIGTLTQDGPPPTPGALKISAETAAGSVFVGHKLPVADFAGRTVTISARIKTSAVSAPPKPYNGVKVQFNILTDGKRDYPQVKIPYSADLPWTEVSLTRAIPANATELSLRVGLEKVTGTLWITDIKITAAP